MGKSYLFPEVKSLLHGGDYNPEQWLDRPDILKEDIRMMKKAGVNVASLGVFSWSVYEPFEGEFHFEWMDEIIETLAQNGIYTVLATPSGARPVWLDRKYPEAMRVRSNGVRNKHGLRHNHCMSSPVYREKVKIISQKLAKRYGDNSAVILWHLSNEFGGECYCEICEERFREYLREKFHGDIEKLNHEWWTTFWSHRYQDFSQIEAPVPNGETTIHGLNLAWKEFTTWNMTDYMKHEMAVISEITKEKPFTTNFMKLYQGLDYHVMCKELDLISWDGYPKWGLDEADIYSMASETAFDHGIMRSMKRDRPFLLMESVPSQVNWHEVNKLKRPGVHKLSSLQAVAAGADSVMYFQWRKGRGSFEQYHGAVVDHLGRDDTRVFKDVEEVGAILKTLQEVAGTIIKAKVALLFDWPNRWAVKDMAGLSIYKNYEKTCYTLFEQFFRVGIEVDIVSSKADISQYSFVIAPMLYLTDDETTKNIKSYVAGGGTVLATYLTGYINENTLCYLGGFPGNGLTEVFGLYSEEIDSLYASEENALSHQGQTYKIKDFCERIHVTTAKVLSVYEKDFYQGEPVFTKNTYEKGNAYYVAARVEAQGMAHIFATICEEVGIEKKCLEEGLEYHKREDETASYEFYLNWSDEMRYLEDKGEILIGKKEDGKIVMAPKELAVIRITN